MVSMSDYMKSRPDKRILSIGEQKAIIEKAKKLVIDEILPGNDITIIMLTGGAVNHNMGKYAKPLDDVHKRQYSDVDFVVVVKNKYRINAKWELIAKREHWEVYRIGYVNGKYPIECLFLKEQYLSNENIIREGESKGIPMGKNSKTPYEIIFESRF